MLHIRALSSTMDPEIYITVWGRSGPSDSVSFTYSIRAPRKTSEPSFSAGFSSGAVSAAMHTLVNDGNTEGLFHAIWTESGAVQPLRWIDQPSAQDVYDNYVTALNCSTAADTLACIRAAPVEAVTNASALGEVSWQPHADGVLLKDLPQDLLASGRAARVPAVAGGYCLEILFILTLLKW